MLNKHSKRSRSVGKIKETKTERVWIVSKWTRQNGRKKQRNEMWSSSTKRFVWIEKSNDMKTNNMGGLFCIRTKDALDYALCSTVFGERNRIKRNLIESYLLGRKFHVIFIIAFHGKDDENEAEEETAIWQLKRNGYRLIFARPSICWYVYARDFLGTVSCASSVDSINMRTETRFKCISFFNQKKNNRTALFKMLMLMPSPLPLPQPPHVIICISVIVISCHNYF